ncbi:MAG: F0F1 ATP synthase subunit delta [Candidatus Levybacteria bacterium]|nr:F0F1 ATP synthase subunit delta [Candidatus Levybacteria bacterium]
MSHKLIKELVLASYTNGNLDPEKVEKIVRLLNRALLKQYIKALKNRELETIVCVESPYELDKRYKKNLEDMFPKKKIAYNLDPTLISGLRITQNDLIYELSLKITLDQILKKIRENYD